MTAPLHVLVMGPTGAIGAGIVRHCIDDPRVGTVTAMSRRPLDISHARLRVMIVADFLNLKALEDDIGKHDACFCALGVSQTQVPDEARYREITRDYAMAVGTVLNAHNPAARFSFVSGQGTDPTGKSRWMWARVKGQAENDLRGLFGERLTVFRPGYVRPIGAVKMRTLDKIVAPLSGVFRPLFPGGFTSTLEIARVMIQAATVGGVPPVLENKDINRVAAETPAPAPAA